MARLSERWILDPEVTPIDARGVSEAQVAEALMALQISHLDSGVTLEQAFKAILVSVVAHLKRHGHMRAVILDEDTSLSDFGPMSSPHQISDSS